MFMVLIFFKTIKAIKIIMLNNQFIQSDSRVD